MRQKKRTGSRSLLSIAGLMVLAMLLGGRWSVAGAAGRVAGTTVAPEPALQAAPQLESVDCATFKGLDTAGANVECGYLLVPENRANPQSRTIKVAYAILKSPAANPQPDPVVYLTGGPGDIAIDSNWGDWGSSPLGKRDLILVDPRGVGNSQPAMSCSPDRPPDASTQNQAPTAGEIIARVLNWAQSCRQALISQGFELSAYNSQANANDLEDLRRALGYPKWNLYGISYGTRTALYTLRAFPDGIRSLVLDSVLPPQLDRIGSEPVSTAGSLAALFSACQTDPACNRSYPDLQRKFDEVVQKLDQTPIKISVPAGDSGGTKQAWITGADVAGGLKEAMKRGWLAQIAPLAIERIYAGDHDILEKIYPGLAATENPAVYTTVLCHDEGARFDPQAFAAEVEKHPELKSLFAADQDAAICPVWGAGQAGPAELQPVQSDVPTLILNGSDYDPATPPAYAKLAASTLSRSYLYVFPNATHSLSFDDCPRAMMAAFLDDPAKAPDSSCMAQMKGITFVTDVYPNRGALELFTIVQTPGSPLSLAIGLIGLLFVAAIVALPVAYFRTRRQASDAQGLPNLARLTLWLVAILNLVFMAGVWMLSKKALADNYGWVTLVGFSPHSSQVLFLLPWLACLLTLGLLAFAFLAWKNRWWGKAERVFFTIVTLAGLCFTGFLIYAHVLSVSW